MNCCQCLLDIKVPPAKGELPTLSGSTSIKAAPPTYQVMLFKSVERPVVNHEDLHGQTKSGQLTPSELCANSHKRATIEQSLKAKDGEGRWDAGWLLAPKNAVAATVGPHRKSAGGVGLLRSLQDVYGTLVTAWNDEWRWFLRVEKKVCVSIELSPNCQCARAVAQGQVWDLLRKQKPPPF